MVEAAPRRGARASRTTAARTTFGGGCAGALQRHVVAHLATGSPVENTAGAYLANLRVQEAAYESHATGRRIALQGYDPPATAAPFVP